MHPVEKSSPPGARLGSSRLDTPRVRSPRGSLAMREGRKKNVHDPSDNEDIRNVEAFLAGDQSAFEALFDKYREKVHGIAYRFVRNAEDALEVTQEVFLRVYLGLKNFKTNSRFYTWLYRIAVNRSIDFTRSRKPQTVIGFDTFDVDQWGRNARRGSPSPVEAAQEKELEERLAEAVETLSPKHRAVFVLHASQNLSYKQIAEVLDCNIGTVMSRLFYARKKLQELLTEAGFEVLGDRENKN